MTDLRSFIPFGISLNSYLVYRKQEEGILLSILTVIDLNTEIYSILTSFFHCIADERSSTQH